MTVVFRSREITANLQKNPSTSDVLQLLRMWRPGESAEDFQERVVEENLLGKASRRRVHDLVTRVLRRRYFPDDDVTLVVRLQAVLRSRLPRAVALKVLYYHTAAAEHLLYRVATDFLYEMRREGETIVRRSDLVRFIQKIDHDREYSTAVVERIARSAATTLRDFGILEGKAHKRIVPVHVPPELAAYMAYALRDEGHTGRQIVRHVDWRLFLLTEREAEEAIGQAAHLGHYVFASAGDIKRFDWKHSSLDEYVNAIT